MPYERSSERVDQANGFKPKTIKTRVGEVTFAVPQVRSGDFYPQALEKGLRSERALNLALAEMYVQGVSTRKVAAVVEKLCGTSVSSAHVSNAALALDQTLQAWRNRALAECRYLVLDARYERVRIDGQVRDAAVLVAIGVEPSGKRRVLGVSVSLSEAEAHWRTFLASLLTRGLSGVQMITSDAHEGLAAARKAVFGAAPWQRCQFHLQQNAQAYVPRVELQAEVASDIRVIFNAADKAAAGALLDKAVLKAGFIAEAVFHPSEQGTPQGGPISPIQANLALDGLEVKLREKYPRATANSRRAKVNLIRFADDVVITGSSQELLENEVKPIVAAFLKERGLELSIEKTRVVHIDNGFDFLGQHIRRYKGRVLIKPSRKSIHEFLAKIRAVSKTNAQATAGHLIMQLNPIIRGWTNTTGTCRANKSSPK